MGGRLKEKESIAGRKGDGDVGEQKKKEKEDGIGGRV
jgi:hypothetical protein